LSSARVRCSGLLVLCLATGAWANDLGKPLFAQDPEAGKVGPQRTPPVMESPERKRPGESDLEFHRRLCGLYKAQRQDRLRVVRQEAERSGKEKFDFERLRAAYARIKPTLPGREELEEDYYLNYASVRTLEEYVKALEMTDLYDGGDMHLDPP